MVDSGLGGFCPCGNDRIAPPSTTPGAPFLSGVEPTFSSAETTCLSSVCPCLNGFGTGSGFSGFCSFIVNFPRADA